MRAARMGRGGPPVSVRELERGRRGNLTCLHCDALVKFTPTYVKKQSNLPVAAYLSLIANEQHLDYCPFNVNRYLDTLVAESHALEDTEPCLTKHGGRYLFRLNYLGDAFAGLRAASWRADSAEDAVPPAGVAFVPSRQRIAAYFRSAVGVARIRALVDSSREMEDLVTIRYRDRTLAWRDFFYDDDHYLTLYKRLCATNRGSTYPLALAVVAKSHTVSVGRSGPRYVVQCYAQIVRDPESGPAGGGGTAPVLESGRRGRPAG